MNQSRLDTWITKEPKQFPIHFNFDPLSPNYDWSLRGVVQDGQCDSCKCKVGIVLIETGDGGTSGEVINYYQIDEDAEPLWCDNCHDEAFGEI